MRLAQAIRSVLFKARRGGLRGLTSNSRTTWAGFFSANVGVSDMAGSHVGFPSPPSASRTFARRLSNRSRSCGDSMVRSANGESPVGMKKPVSGPGVLENGTMQVVMEGDEHTHHQQGAQP